MKNQRRIDIGFDDRQSSKTQTLVMIKMSRLSQVASEAK
jgi:hypothetical protein